jgi:hypothetical protein
MKQNGIFLCRGCGKDISNKAINRRKFCTHECFTQWARKNHPFRIRENRQCKTCNKIFEVIKSNPKKYCSTSCSATYNNTRRKHSSLTKNKIKKAYLDGKLIGLSRKGRKGKLVEKTCPVCNKKYEIPLWKEKSGLKKYCSKKCCYKRPNQGGYHAGSVRNFKSGWYESKVAGKVWLDSSYEFIMARYLDDKGYNWIKNTKGFPYLNVDGDDANYVPDFYIKNLDLWVETKGYMVKNDQNKLDHFPHKIILIGKKQIYNKELWGF